MSYLPVYHLHTVVTVGRYARASYADWYECCASMILKPRVLLFRIKKWSVLVFGFCNSNYQVFYPRKASRCVSQVNCLIYFTLRAEGNVQ